MRSAAASTGSLAVQSSARSAVLHGDLEDLGDLEGLGASTLFIHPIALQQGCIRMTAAVHAFHPNKTEAIVRWGASPEQKSRNQPASRAIAFELTWPLIGGSGYPSMTASEVRKEGFNADERR